jgi:hypothetical protein
MRVREFALSAARPLASRAASKVLPGVGTALSAKDALDRWQQGDRTGAVISTLAALGWLVPGPLGWTLGGGLEAANFARDLREHTPRTSLDMDLRHIGKTESLSALKDALDGRMGAETRAYVQEMMIELANDNDLDLEDDIDEVIDLTIKNIHDRYAGIDADQDWSPDLPAATAVPTMTRMEATSRVATQARTKNIMAKLRTRYPQANNDAEALLLHFDHEQRLDRQDISRLDSENDQEEAEIDRLAREIERLRDRHRASEALNPSLSFESRRYKEKSL